MCPSSREVRRSAAPKAVEEHSNRGSRAWTLTRSKMLRRTSPKLQNALDDAQQMLQAAQRAQEAAERAHERVAAAVYPRSIWVGLSVYVAQRIIHARSRRWSLFREIASSKIFVGKGEAALFVLKCLFRHSGRSLRLCSVPLLSHKRYLHPRKGRRHSRIAGLQ